MSRELARYSDLGSPHEITEIIRIIKRNQDVSPHQLAEIIDSGSHRLPPVRAILELLNVFEIIITDFGIRLTEEGEKIYNKKKSLADALLEKLHLIDIGRGILEANWKHSPEKGVTLEINKTPLKSRPLLSLLSNIGVFHLKNNTIQPQQNITQKIIKQKNKKISQDALEQKLQRQKEIGLLAEKIVLTDQQERFPGKNFEVMHVAMIDVSAGYDIASFKNKESKEHDLFIEVKATQGNQYFFISDNELKTAKYLKEKYILAIVNTNNRKIKYIPNPSKKIEANDWELTPKSYQVNIIR